jgi:Icc-related predicted phosphoesterase
MVLGKFEKMKKFIYFIIRVMIRVFIPSRKLRYEIRGKLLHLYRKFFVHYTMPSKTFKHLVCSAGTGHSGSGTINDFLTEFDNCTVVAAHDHNWGGGGGGVF